MQVLELGRVEVSPAATGLAVDVDVFLDRHGRGDWGDVDERRWQRNDFCLRVGEIVRSTYRLEDGVDLAISTARDRSYTRVMLNEELDPCEVSAVEGYARWARYYDREKNPLIAVEDPLVDAILAELDVGRALDVGAGTGRLSLKLAHRGVAVTAFDRSPEMLHMARCAAQAAQLSIDLCLGSIAEGLPFESASFDLVVCALMLCHVPDLAGAARAFSRVVRRGGVLLVTDFHPDSVAMGWRTTSSDPDGVYLLPNAPHTRADYIEAIEGAGFKVLEVRDIPIRAVPRGIFAFHDEVVRKHGDTSLCLIVRAEK